MSATTVTLGVIGVALSIPAFLYFLYSALKLVRFITAGQSLKGRFDKPAQRLWQMLVEVFGHTNFWRARPLASVAHWLVMVGFLGGIVVWFEAYIQTFNPAGGWPILSDWLVYHFIEELLGLGTVLGITALFLIRVRHGSTKRESRFYNSITPSAWLVEAIVFIEGLGMLLVKASKIATFGAGSPWADFVSIHIAQLLPASPVLISVFALIKLVSGLLFLVVIAVNLNWGILWHRFTAFFNIYFQRNADGSKANGRLKPMTDHAGEHVTLDTVEDDTVLGLGTLEDASWKMLLDTTACTECGRCQDLCPAWNTEKPLSPKKLIMDLRDAAVANSDILLDPSARESEDSHAGVDVLRLAGQGGVISDEVLWSCTNCGACVDQCPVDIEHLDHIADLRRFQVLTESDFPSELQGMFTNIETKGNPWGRNNAERAGWVEEARRDGVEVPVFGEDDLTDFAEMEYLFWVGCAGAYDEHGKKTTRAVVDLLHTAGVKFAVLSTGETCTGDPARRAGNEFLFQMQAAQNIETLDGVFDGVPQGQRKIITTCPHCFNTLRNEYPDFDGHYDVFHHTQLLNRLVRDKWLTPVPRTAENRKPITYHDPCFLGRQNQVYDPPRELLGVTGVNLVEMDKSRNEAFCCGAGGARMFMEEKIGRRVNEFRTEQAMDTGAEEIATACPFCTNMLDGGVKALSQDTAGPKPVVQDVAVRLRDSVLVDGALPSPREKSFYSDERRSLTITPMRNPVDENASGSTAVSAPSSPSAPAAPAPASGPPSIPGAPGAPGSAAVAVPPSAPAAPPAPSAGSPAPPAAPSAPAAPMAPSAPSVPGAPAAPSTPSAVPAAPASASAPPASSAGAPVPPAAPSAPGAPSAPAAPPAPGAPAGNAPVPPAAPGAPSTPPAPSTPAAPAAGAPVPPAAPSAPAKGPIPPAPGMSAPPPAAPSASATASDAIPPIPPAPEVPQVSSPPAPPAPPAPTAEDTDHGDDPDTDKR